MRAKRAPLAVVGAAAVVLGVPGVGMANHVGISGDVTARLSERASSLSWRVAVEWNVTCTGVGARGASYTGNLYLIDPRTNEEIYMGGVFSSAGRANQLVAARDEERSLLAELRISCFDNETVHGSNVLVVRSGPVLIPARYDDGEGGPADGGGGQTAPGRNPTSPLRPGGCSTVLQGTDGPDRLTGTAGGDIVFGYGGGDRIRGLSGHDCLIGGRGNDQLVGSAGDDRLTGGTGSDLLLGGTGTNAYDAGAGSDVVNAVNRRRELVRCGPGRDSARVDRRDRVASCERVRRVG